MGKATYRALRGVSLEICEGELVAIMGPSGSGKSTLLNILGLLDMSTQGRYRFDGTDVNSFDDNVCAAIRSRRIGFVFQASNLLARNTALENVELPLLYAGLSGSLRRRCALEALETVGLATHAAHRPQELSGGEQQRVAVARAIVAGPPLILADEPTGSVDSRNGLRIMAQFQRLHRSGKTIVLVTHDSDIAACAERIVRVQDGTVVSDGPVTHRRNIIGELAGIEPG